MTLKGFEFENQCSKPKKNNHRKKLNKKTMTQKATRKKALPHFTAF
jgi:hypothetical protein